MVALTTPEYKYDPKKCFYAQNFFITHRETLQKTPFVLNKPQQKLQAIVNRQRRTTGIVRVICLKSRKMGLSTFIEAMLFRMTLTTPNFSGLVMAHEDTSTRALFGLTRLFKDNLPPGLTPEYKYSNRTEIETQAPLNSALRIQTASSEGVGRGPTPHAAHLSELAYWGEGFAADALQSVKSSIRYTKGTSIFIESTADGPFGCFYDEFRLAEQGLSGFEPVFFSWLEDEDYKLDIPLDHPRFKNVPKEWTDDHARLRLLGATDQQLAWRLHTIGADCGGSLNRWSIDYPTVPEDAFSGTQRDFFPSSITTPNYEACKKAEAQKPAKRYDILPTGEWSPTPNGPFRCWAFPAVSSTSTTQYLIAADVASGKEIDEEQSGGKKLGDYSTFGVWNRETLEEVAVYHQRCDPDTFAEKLCHIGKAYNNADLLIEANFYGTMTIRTCLRLNYPRVMRRETTGKATLAAIFPGNNNWTEMGLWTTPGNRPLMLRDMESMLRNKEIVIFEPEAWKEMMTFRYDKAGKPVAARGCYDDRVMRIAIACSVLINDAWAEKRRAMAKAPPPGSYDHFFDLYKKAMASKTKESAGTYVA